VHDSRDISADNCDFADSEKSSGIRPNSNFVNRRADLGVCAFPALFPHAHCKVEKVQSKFHLDERINEINAKSARNALIAVYLGVLINILIYSSISTELLLEIIGVSLAVYLASLAIYYYRTFLSKNPEGRHDEDENQNQRTTRPLRLNTG